ncbi:MAG: NHLP leader peptide family natural product precursor [Planctomycetaceae bacterium]|nr:NHLP leader peptide family natural product precursor [Planctomycetaceae bacterium]
MTEQKNALAQLFAACWKDEALKARFMNDPKAVLAEYDIPVPDGMDVKVVENADDCVHITMPRPPARHMGLSDADLATAAGGCVMGSFPTVADPNC